MAPSLQMHGVQPSIDQISLHSISRFFSFDFSHGTALKITIKQADKLHKIYTVSLSGTAGKYLI